MFTLLAKAYSQSESFLGHAYESAKSSLNALFYGAKATAYAAESAAYTAKAAAKTSYYTGKHAVPLATAAYQYYTADAQDADLAAISRTYRATKTLAALDLQETAHTWRSEVSEPATEAAASFSSSLYYTANSLGNGLVAAGEGVFLAKDLASYMMAEQEGEAEAADELPLAQPVELEEVNQEEEAKAADNYNDYVLCDAFEMPDQSGTWLTQHIVPTPNKAEAAPAA